MKLWLLGLGLALLCAANADSKCSEDHSQMLGKWYVPAIASNCEYLLKYKDTIEILVVEMTLKTDNEMHMVTNFPEKNGCKEHVMKFTKLDDGTFFHESVRGSTKLIETLSTDCKTYAILFAEHKYNGKVSNHLAIYTRTPELTSELKEKFLETASGLKFTKEQILFPRGVACQNKEEDEMPVV